MIKNLLDEFVKRNNAVSDFIHESSDQYQDGKEVIPSFAEKLQETNFNPALGNSFAELLQLSDDENIYNQFALEDIGKLYQSLLTLQEYNIETYVEAGYFEFSVMDNAAKAREIAMTGLEMAKQKINQLETLLSEIDKESV